MDTWLLIGIAAVLVVIFIIVSMRTMSRESDKPGPASPPDETYPAKHDFEAEQRARSDDGSPTDDESRQDESPSAPTTQHDHAPMG